MSFWNWLIGEETKERKKRIFISFAIEDEKYRNDLVVQSKRAKSPFEFIDMSVKKKWNEKEWKEKCRTKIKGCNGVIALLSKNTHCAGGAKWEIKCALEEKIPTIGMQIKWNEKGAKPKELKNRKVVRWTWDNIDKFIQQL